MRSPQVLVLGDATAAEMRPVFEALSCAAAGGDIRLLADAAGTELLAANGWFADVGVVFQSWPDEFSPSDVRRLLTLFPLARWTCCYGSWCASDGRTRAIWPPGVRVAVGRATERIERALSAARDSGRAEPPLPWTASLDEIFAHDCCERENVALKAGTLVCVRTPDTPLRHYLRDMLSASGCRVLAETGGAEPDVVVWDIDPLCDAVFEALRQYRRTWGRGVLIALSGLAHPEDGIQLCDAGADAIVDKLAVHHALLETIANLLAQPARLRDAG
jgi:hypothetical protein